MSAPLNSRCLVFFFEVREQTQPRQMAQASQDAVARALREHAPGCVDKEVVVRQHEPPVHYLECTAGAGEPTGPAVLYLHGLFGSRFEWCVCASSHPCVGATVVRMHEDARLHPR
jgi:hypothetical protein